MLSSQQAADIGLLALAVYRECRGESSLAKLAVAFSIMERTKDNGWWGHDVLAVLFHPHQYSSLTGPHDPQLTVWPQNSQEIAWIDCLTAAWQAYLGRVENPVPGATSYYDNSIDAPDWADDKLFVKQIGRLRFFAVQP